MPTLRNRPSAARLPWHAAPAGLFVASDAGGSLPSSHHAVVPNTRVRRIAGVPPLLGGNYFRRCRRLRLRVAAGGGRCQPDQTLEPGLHRHHRRHQLSRQRGVDDRCARRRGPVTALGFARGRAARRSKHAAAADRTCVRGGFSGTRHGGGAEGFFGIIPGGRALVVLFSYPGLLREGARIYRNFLWLREFS